MRGIVEQPIYTPRRNVRLTGGLLLEAHENNIGYLKSLSMDSILYWFRVKAGLPAPGEPYRGHFEDNIKGQTAGLFLMGAGNSLRWREDDELRSRMDRVVATVDASKETDGFIEPIAKSEFGTKEYPNYVRTWLNYGLSAAHTAGNSRALHLMRGMQSWFNRCDERAIAKHLVLGYQGVIANTTVYLSDVGIREDLDVTVECYQENWWLGQFIRGHEGAVHERPTPHGTELEAITAYVDLYIATGKPLYLNATNAAYRMFRDRWQHVGGGIVAIEHTDMAPDHKYNELCPTAHWIYVNQRYHRLFPDEERYAAEIEKSLYNVVIANQIGDRHIRYHAFIDIQKDGDCSTRVSCCAGLGTRVLGSLPEFLYSIAVDGILVDIYAPSQISWTCSSMPVLITTSTDQPTGGDVRIRVSTPSSLPFTVRLRIPSWTIEDVGISVNGEHIVVGTPGTYCPIDRVWSDGDTISFGLPMGFRVTRYAGGDAVPGFERYAIEYGPMLLGVVGPPDFRGRYIRIDHDHVDPACWLQPIEGAPSRFAVKGKPGYEVMPYFRIQDQVFTCYPILAADST